MIAFVDLSDSGISSPFPKRTWARQGLGLANCILRQKVWMRCLQPEVILNIVNVLLARDWGTQRPNDIMVSWTWQR